MTSTIEGTENGINIKLRMNKSVVILRCCFRFGDSKILNNMRHFFTFYETK